MNRETEELIRASKGWHEIEVAVSSGQLSQSIGVIIPSVMQEVFAEMFGRLLLGDSPLWKDGTHPDMLVAGNLSDAPKINECRQLQEGLFLPPLSAPRRLAVIYTADKMRKEAANSMLKITEEPPQHGNILFLTEVDNFIPTIKSRIWLISIDLPSQITESHSAPSTISEWAYWMSAMRKPSTEILCLEIQGWARFFAENGDFNSAQKAELIYRTAIQKHLSVPFIEDMAFAVFKEGVPYEQIFSELR